MSAAPHAPADLSRFVGEAVRGGLDYTSIHRLARAAGWRDREVADAFCALQGIALPQRPGASSARETFYYLLTFTALYVWVIDLAVLLFNSIDLLLPEPGQAEAPHVSMIRSALAGIAVALPLFAVLWLRLRRQLRVQPEKAVSAVRRWLVYLSLYAAAVTALADTITLVYYLLEGEQTLRFLLKVAVLFAISGTAFFYLASTLRWETRATGAA